MGSKAYDRILLYKNKSLLVSVKPDGNLTADSRKGPGAAEYWQTENSCVPSQTA